MGNSTRTLQQMVDGVSTIGDLSPVLTNTGGFANEPALTIANAAMSDLISQRFNFKWNRIKIPPFVLTSYQQDYASVNLSNLGWLESAAVVDVNNTSIPKPTHPIETVRDLDYTSWSGSPAQISWMPNGQLEFSVWPGPAAIYTSPLGAVTSPVNGPTNIQDGNGVILVLTTYGVTGQTPPLAPAGAAPGDTVLDGSCVWTVADPSSAGFRVCPRPPQAGNVWLVRVFAQAKAPRFTSLNQTLDPIPDDYSKWFEDGFIAYAHRHSGDPSVRAKFPPMKSEWMAAMESAIRQGDREAESLGFYPDRTVMGGGGSLGPTVGNPLNWRRW